MKTLCFIGGVLTFGEGDRDSLGWAGRLNRQLLREGKTGQHFNLGVPYETLPLMSKRAERACRLRLERVAEPMIFLEPGHADLAILADGKRRTDAATFEAHLTTIIDTLERIAPVILVGPTPVVEREALAPCPVTGEMIRYGNLAITAASKRMAILCETWQVPFLDLNAEMLKGSAYEASIESDDGLVPSSGGHKLIADYAHTALASLLETDDG